MLGNSVSLNICAFLPILSEMHPGLEGSGSEGELTSGTEPFCGRFSLRQPRQLVLTPPAAQEGFWLDQNTHVSSRQPLCFQARWVGTDWYCSLGLRWKKQNRRGVIAVICPRRFVLRFRDCFYCCFSVNRYLQFSISCYKDMAL